ncbi:MAG: hypothetical protein KDD94_00390 [Calditrichaeota bacterium]|nr:hypothetical protein [Calditrichota bacterium]
MFFKSVFIISVIIVFSFRSETILESTYVDLEVNSNQQTGKVTGKISLPERATRVVVRRRRSRSYRRNTIELSEKARQYTPYEKTMIYLEPLDEKNNVFIPKRVVLEQENVSFQPAHVIAQSGNDILVVNKDEIFHNVFSTTEGYRFNIGKKRKDEIVPIKLTKTGHVQVFCDIHAFMSAIISIVETPYYTLVDNDQNFVIENVPEGRYRLIGWNDRAEFTGAIIEVRSNTATNLTNIIRFQ